MLNSSFRQTSCLSQRFFPLNLIYKDFTNPRKIKQNFYVRGYLKSGILKNQQDIQDHLNKWIVSFQDLEKEVRRIESSQKSDYLQFLNFVKTEFQQPITSHNQFKQEIQDKIADLTSITLQNKFIDIQKCEQFFDEELNFKCDQHSKDITFFDLGQDISTQKRVACLQCFDEIPRLDYKSINYAKQKWKEIKNKDFKYGGKLFKI